ncbi:MAG TPA: hypothetical protein VMX57_04815, partial [Planctomycetota bacterium]|nr:hypothetical protein [Planctomycetota bacterium]
MSHDLKARGVEQGGVTRLAGAVVAMILVMLPALAGAQDEKTDAAAAVLKAADARRGLCLHLGCGGERAPELTAGLAEQSGMMVHGLATDDASLARARSAVTAKGLAGRAVVEKLPLVPLPYLNDLADLVVIDDLDALAKQGLTLDEVL